MSKRFKVIRIISGIVFSGAGVLLVLLIILPPDRAKYMPADKDLMTLTGSLIHQPHYGKYPGKGGGNYFMFVLDRYPGAVFENESVFLKATNWELIKAEVKIQDTIRIKVLRSAFEKYYLKRDSLSLLQQIANYPLDRFSFYSFTCRNKEYVTNLYEAAKKHRRQNFVMQFILGLAFVGMGIYSFFAKE